MSSVFYNTEGSWKDNNPLLQEHIGTVIDINDPANLCRIRVYIPELLDYNNVNWISRMVPNFPGFVYSTPSVGEKVRVWFRDNNIMDGIYGLDYVHTDTDLRNMNFKPGEYGFIDNNSNQAKISGKSLILELESIDADVKNLNVTGSISSGTSYTGSFSTGDGRVATIQGGLIIDIS